MYLLVVLDFKFKEEAWMDGEGVVRARGRHSYVTTHGEHTRGIYMLEAVGPPTPCRLWFMVQTDAVEVYQCP